MAHWWAIGAFCGGPQSYLKIGYPVKKNFIVLVEAAMKEGITSIAFQPLDIIKITANIKCSPSQFCIVRSKNHQYFFSLD